MINTHNADHKQTYRKNIIICDINRQRQCGEDHVIGQMS